MSGAALGADRDGEILAVNGGDGWFAGGVDGDEFDGVRVAKGGGELVEKFAGAGVAVGLEEYVDSPVAALAGGGEGGADFGGVMAVVVDDGDAADGAAMLEAAVDATETAEAFRYETGRNAEFDADGNGGGGVEQVVASGYV